MEEFSPADPASPPRNLACKKFVLTWLATTLILIGVAFPAGTMFLLNWSDNVQDQWIYEIRRRKVCAAEMETRPSRVLITGGSSGLFSLDAQLLTSKLGRPVLNLSTHGALGLRFYLQDSQKVALRGDTVLLHLEYVQYLWNANKLGEAERQFYWTHEPTRILTLDWPQSFQQLYGNPYSDYRESWDRWNRRLRGNDKEGKSAMRSGYSFMELSPQGDVANMEPFPGFISINPPSVAPDKNLSKDSERELTRYFEWARKHGITVLAVLPAVTRPEDGKPGVRAFSKKIMAFYQRHGIPVISQPDLQELPSAFFLDTGYHANSAGRRVITETLLPSLKSALAIPVTRGERAVFLVHSPTARFHPGLAFPGNDETRYRFISKSDLHHPFSTQPQQARDWAKSGMHVRFAEAEIKSLMEDAGISTRVIETKTTTVQDWIARFPNHLLAVVTIGPDMGNLADWNLPAPFNSMLRMGGKHRVALLGTGRFANTLTVIADEKEANWKRAVGDPWPAKNGIALEMELLSTDSYPPEKGRFPLTIERYRIFDGKERGLGIAAIDPDTGLLVDRRVFPKREVTEYELREIVGEAN